MSSKSSLFRTVLSLSLLGMIYAGEVQSSESHKPSSVPEKSGARANKSPRLIVPVTKESLKKSAPDQDMQDAMDGYEELPPWGYEPRAEDERSKRGKSLYLKNNCQQCHSIFGKGGEVGPPLDGIGSHRGPEWLLARLLDPKEQMKKFAHVFGNRPNVMPHPALDKQDASLIVDYILTLPEPKEGYLVASHKASLPRSKKSDKNAVIKEDIDSAIHGAKLFYQMQCYTCHSTDGSRDRFGPDLAGLGSETRADALKKFLQRSIKSSLMKAQAAKLSDKDLNDLKAFLMTIPTADYKN